MDDYQIRNFLKFAPARLGLVPKKYLFIHIPKNGGMSLRYADTVQPKLVIANRRRLKSKSYANVLLQTMSETGDHAGYEHARLRDVDVSVRRACIPFAIVRNPWSRVVSRFTFAMQAMKLQTAAKDYSARNFEEFLEERHLWGDKEYFWHRAIRGWYPQLDYVVDEKHFIAADILRLEAIDQELPNYLGIDSPLERRNVSSSERAGYQSFYCDRTIQIVADWYAKDIESFGFDFDTSATKNTLFS
ncbi:hypothetical protein E1180_15990 [Roseibium denhamense]|uniref:Sulfotransferase family protein n=1 Tax=Roseibium denhamense TaxID=76305 RepID=A0ABY1PMC0_9HYPH|nr:sulfotransferase family 2 domain-containing protein [Roseibium denhamense]MTI07012.1 hypothetical protein [Roseibium denhamense]SMP36575.1 Sulfotransferase family protein [Roseibium denhamense]